MSSASAAPAAFPSVDDQVAAVGAAALTPVVRRLVAEPGAEVRNWRRQEIQYWLHNPIRGGLFRFSGEAALDGIEPLIPWSVILRVAQPPPPERSGAVPDDWKYWRRETLLYATGRFDDLPSRLTPPRCYGIEERPDGRVWLWQEDLGELRKTWEQQRLVDAARDLGEFHGVYLEHGGQRPLPQEPWLAQAWLATWIERIANFPRNVEPALARTDVWEQPLVRELYPPALRERVVALWAGREALLEGLGRLPRTLCHNDAWPSNLFDVPGGAPRTAAIDWEFAGPGGVGTDLGQFLFGCQSGFYIDAGNAEAYHAFKERVLVAYLDGLHGIADALPADEAQIERQVRFGCAARGALQWGWAALPWIAKLVTDPEEAARREALRGLPAEAIARRDALALRFALDLGDEARSLLSTI